MNTIYCPAKDKDVCVTQTIIDASSFDNEMAVIPGRIKCWDSDCNCEDGTCPLLKRT